MELITGIDIQAVVASARFGAVSLTFMRNACRVLYVAPLTCTSRVGIDRGLARPIAVPPGVRRVSVELADMAPHGDEQRLRGWLPHAEGNGDVSLGECCPLLFFIQ